MSTGGAFLGKRWLRGVVPISTKDSGPNIATPFSTFSVNLFFFFGGWIVIACVFGSITNSSASVISSTTGGSTPSSSSSIIRGRSIIPTFLTFLVVAGKGIGSAVFLSSVSLKTGLIDTISFLLSANFLNSASLSNPFFVSSTMTGTVFSGSSVSVSPSSFSSPFLLVAGTVVLGARWILGFLTPLITTATLSLSSTFGFTINFSFILAKGFIAYIIWIYKFLLFNKWKIINQLSLQGSHAQLY